MKGLRRFTLTVLTLAAWPGAALAQSGGESGRGVGVVTTSGRHRDGGAGGGIVSLSHPVLNLTGTKS